MDDSANDQMAFIRLFSLLNNFQYLECLDAFQILNFVPIVKMKLEQTAYVFWSAFDVRQEFNSTCNPWNFFQPDSTEAVDSPKEGYLPHGLYSTFIEISDTTIRLPHFQPSKEGCNRQEYGKQHVDSFPLIS